METPAELKGRFPADTCCGYALGNTLRSYRGLQSIAGVREVRTNDEGSADLYADRGGQLISEIASLPWPPGWNCTMFTSPSRAWRIYFCTTPEGACANELEDIFRHAGPRCAGGPAQRHGLMFQTFLQPLMFVFIFGKVMVRSGYMPEAYKSLLLPGIMAISMVFTGVWAVAMPLIAEFQFTREIEDRLLAPMETSWVAIEKVLAGALQALVAGLVVLPRRGLFCGRFPSTLSSRAYFCLLSRFWWPLLGLRGTRFGLQHQSAAYRIDVQHGVNSADLFRLHVLSVERARGVSHPAKSRADQSSCLRQ